MFAGTIFVIVFIAIALAVVAAAFGRRRGGAHGAKAGPSRAGRRLTGLAVTAVILAIGVVIPGLVIAYNANDQSNRAVGGIQLSDTEEHARELFYFNCGNCHTLAAANAVGQVGPNLDQMRPPTALTVNAIQLGRARGQGQMPAALLQGQDAEQVAELVAKVAGR